MMHTGQKVEQIYPWDIWCALHGVLNPNLPSGDEVSTECGRVYTIRTIETIARERRWPGGEFLRFNEILNPYCIETDTGCITEVCFPASNFRPIVEATNENELEQAA